MVFFAVGYRVAEADRFPEWTAGQRVQGEARRDAQDRAMTGDEIVALSKKHTLFEWSAQSKVDPIPVARAKGIYFWTPEGKRFIDFNSQLMCVNIGHGDARVVRAIQEQAATLVYAKPFMATEPRARLGAKLAEIAPGDIDVFFFTNGGAEANENALKLARLVTGRHKILAQLPLVSRRDGRQRHADGRSEALGRRAGAARRRPCPRSVSRHRSRLGDRRAGAVHARGGHPTRRPAHDCRVHSGNGHRHERRAGAAGRLPAGRARAVHATRHPDDLRRGDVRVRPHRRVVCRQSLERRAGPPDDGQGADERVRAARRGRDAEVRSPIISGTTSSSAGSRTTAIRSRAPRRSRRFRCTRTTSCSRTPAGWAG